MDYLFDNWGRIQESLKDKYLFIFLDFDGTVAPITATPDQAALSVETSGLIKKLSANPQICLAFISGRSISDLKEKIKIDNIIYSGNHGLEIEGPKIKFVYTVAAYFRKNLEQIKSVLAGNYSSIKGLLIEDKGLSLSLHYRMAEESQIPQIKAIFEEALAPYKENAGLKVKYGKKIFEVCPAVQWDKGKVVLWLLSRQVFASKDKQVFPIYIGDDVTDEDAFKALRGKGLTVFVGESGQSEAQYYVKNPAQVAQLLQDLELIKEK